MATESELGFRTLAVGSAIGAVLAASNVYTGLTTAYVDGGSITAAILGYGLLRAGARGPVAVGRINVVQATASTAAIMVGVVGLAGPWPALHLLGHEVSPWVLVPWGIALGVLGIVLAHALRPALVERERLPFPTGAATAEVVHALTQRAGEGRRRALVLALAAVLAGIVAYAQQRGGWLPGEIAIPLAALGVDAALGVGLAPLVVATGALFGLRTGLAMAGTGAVVWAFVVPWLHAHGVVATAEFPDAIAWLMWPAVGLLLGDGVVALASQRHALVRSFADLARLQRAATLSRTAGVLSAVLAIALLGRLALGVPLVVCLAALALSVVLSAMIGRAAGETDVAPVGAAGALAQVALGSRGPLASLVAGSIPCGVASQTAQGLWAFAATHLLGARVRPVVIAQIAGVVVGACVSVPVYELLVRTHGLGTEAMPAWGAVAWAATATAVQSDGAAPAGALAAAVIGLTTGIAAAWIRARRPDTLVPSPTAVAIGALTPAAFSAAALLGAIAMFGWARRAPGSAALHGPTVAAGCITGEALVAIVLALALV